MSITITAPAQFGYGSVCLLIHDKRSKDTIQSSVVSTLWGMPTSPIKSAWGLSQS